MFFCVDCQRNALSSAISYATQICWIELGIKVKPCAYRYPQKADWVRVLLALVLGLVVRSEVDNSHLQDARNTLIHI
eukprot:SAG22_NODE_1401_length_4497_cov_101.460891_8_plen_76_part_01